MRAKWWADHLQDCQGPRQGWGSVRAAQRWDSVLGSLHRAEVLQARARRTLRGQEGQR